MTEYRIARNGIGELMIQKRVTNEGSEIRQGNQFLQSSGFISTPQPVWENVPGHYPNLGMTVKTLKELQALETETQKRNTWINVDYEEETAPKEEIREVKSAKGERPDEVPEPTGERVK